MGAIKFYQVGGSVRDSFLGIKSKDIDYAVEAPSFAEMRQAIVARGGEIFLETPQYFTIRANVPGHGACDYVLCRKEGAYSDGRHPDSVAPGTIYDDLARRDFTVNAMAIDEDGKLIDPHGGLEDLQLAKLRCVGKTEERFTEDGLRMLRAIRFAITKNLVLDTDITLKLSDQNFFGPRLVGVSMERVREELTKCFVHDTNATLHYIQQYYRFFRFLFESRQLWLKPTLEKR